MPASLQHHKNRAGHLSISQSAASSANSLASERGRHSGPQLFTLVTEMRDFAGTTGSFPVCPSPDGKGPIFKTGCSRASAGRLRLHWLRRTHSRIVAQNIFFNLLEYFVDASVSESSESVWLGGSCRGTSYCFRSRVFGSASMSGCSPRRRDLGEWAVDVDKSETEHSANEKDLAYAVTSLCQPYRSRH